MVSFTIMGALTNTLDFHLSTQALMIVLVMIFASTILALGAFLAGVERVGPTTASLLSTLEPVFTIILAVILLGESLSWGQLFGGALILAAVLLLTIPGNHRKKKT
jgi:drug/metabolite transporter (DMT)-like permease